MTASIIFYFLIIILISYLFRPKKGYKDFIVGNKQSGWTITAFGLFTLIGGGELIAGATFGYVYGWAGMALFIGYGLAFAILGLLSSKIVRKTSSETITYAEYADENYGRTTGAIVLFSHIVAFFALLVLQITAGGHVISQITSMSYNTSVVVCASVIAAYLTIGGYRAVMITDVVQGIVMILLFAVILYAITAVQHTSSTGASGIFETPTFDAFWGVIVSGIVIGLASADVWQRIFAAKSPSSARYGFIVGGLALTIFGSLIVFLGMLSKLENLTDLPEGAFVSVLQTALPAPILTAAIFATIAAILSTADTEIFLVSSLLDRGRRILFKSSKSYPIRSESATRAYILLIAGASAITAFWSSDLALLFNWMFVGYMVFAPTVAISLFINADERAMLISFSMSGLLFAALFYIGHLNLENSYVLTIPALIFIPLCRLLKKKD